MQIAILFDSCHASYKGGYSWMVLRSILVTGILQASGRHMRIRTGDIWGTGSTRGILAENLFASQWDLLNVKKLRGVLPRTVVFAWVVENVDETTARRLHKALSSDGGYLGMLAVNLANPTHLRIYRLSIPLKYRVKGMTCHIFFSMSDEDGKDTGLFASLRQAGFFEVVEWEDLGAHETIFDNYDTQDHFERVECFRSVAASNLAGGNDEADDLVLMLEESNPRLLATLGTAARALECATHEEDVAQAGVSARRYIEQLADTLFPARNGLFNGREVGRDKFKNRLWAYVDLSIPSTSSDRTVRVQTLGKEIDRLLDEVNSCAVHAGVPKRERLGKALSDLAKLTIALFQLDPELARKPYFAFQTNIIRFALGEL